jgi:anaerobic selenocysteine-containing dehydrogenase
LQEPAIEPMGESKPPAFIWGELAKRFGIGKHFDMDTEAWHRLRLSSGDPAFTGVQSKDGTQFDLTYDRLKTEKIIKLNVTDDDDDVYTLMPMAYGTPSGRIEFYCENLTEVGAAMGKFSPPRIHGAEREKYPLQLYPGRHRVFMQSQFYEFAELRAIGGHKAELSLNPVEAAKRGIREGDLVEIFNDRGKVLSTATLSEAFPPGMAHLWYAYPKKDHIADPPTVLSTTLSSHETEDEFTVAWGKQWLKQNVEAGMPAMMVFQNGGAGTFETLWDDLCEVRKVEEA